MITLKHLSVYLPYNPKVLNGYGDLSDLKTEFIRYSKLYLNSNKIDNIALILRPLSDLAKEIEVNEEKFVPTKALSIWDLEGITIIDIPHIPVNLYELLLKWNFDVFGLIPQGLAIDINTLNN